MNLEIGAAALSSQLPEAPPGCVGSGEGGRHNRIREVGAVGAEEDERGSSFEAPC